MIEIIWKRILENEEQLFTQIRGQEFTYKIENISILPNITNRNISNKEFEKALKFVPLLNTTSIQHLQGSSYIYAILIDKRIQKSDW